MTEVPSASRPTSRTPRSGERGAGIPLAPPTLPSVRQGLGNGHRRGTWRNAPDPRNRKRKPGPPRDRAPEGLSPPRGAREGVAGSQDLPHGWKNRGISWVGGAARAVTRLETPQPPPPETSGGSGKQDDAAPLLNRSPAIGPCSDVGFDLRAGPGPARVRVLHLNDSSLRSPGSSREQVGDLLVRGEALRRELREHRTTVHPDFEGAAPRLDQLDLRLGVQGLDLGGQTDRLRLVVSLDAVLDRDAHVAGPPRAGMMRPIDRVS